MSQVTFAQKHGCADKTLKNYELGKRDLPLEFFKDLIATYSVSADWLLFGVGPRYLTAANASAANAIRAACEIAASGDIPSAVEFGNLIFQHQMQHGPLNDAGIASLLRIALHNPKPTIAMKDSLA